MDNHRYDLDLNIHMCKNALLFQLIDAGNISSDILQQALLNSGVSSNGDMTLILEGTPTTTVSTDPQIEQQQMANVSQFFTQQNLSENNIVIEGVANTESLTTEKMVTPVKKDDPKKISVRGIMMVSDTVTGKLNRHVIRKVS